MKEYSININIIAEAEESDIDRVTEYAQELADNIIQDENFAYDGDIKVTNISVEDVQNLSNYDSDFTGYDEDDEDEEDRY